MIILLLFAFISGLVTILAPCIWPLLPIILSTSSTGGHMKPFGVTLGIMISFTILTFTIAFIISLIPFGIEVLRTFSVLIIGLLGVMLVVPKFSSLFEGYISRMTGAVGRGVGQTSSGFGGGLVTGLALGVVWTPCAGPILTTIATLAASQQVSAILVLMTLAYVIGISIPLFLFAFFGSIIFTKSKLLSPYTGRIQQGFGVIMVLVALAIATNYDKVLQAKLLDAFPGYSQFIYNLEGNREVKEQLKLLKE